MIFNTTISPLIQASSGRVGAECWMVIRAVNEISRTFANFALPATRAFSLLKVLTLDIVS